MRFPIATLFTLSLNDSQVPCEALYMYMYTMYIITCIQCISQYTMYITVQVYNVYNSWFLNYSTHHRRQCLAVIIKVLKLLATNFSKVYEMGKLHDNKETENENTR